LFTFVAASRGHLRDSTAFLFLHAVVCFSAQSSLVNPRVYRTKATKFLSDVEELSPCHGLHPRCHSTDCGMPVQRWKVGYANFRRFAPKIGYLSATKCEGLLALFSSFCFGHHTSEINSHGD